MRLRKNALGQEYAIQGNYDRALLAYQQATMADPKLPKIHLGMGLILLHLKRFDEALAQINLDLALVRGQNGCRYETRIEAEKTASH